MGASDADEADFRNFVVTNATSVMAYCMRRASHPDAQEAAAETFAVAWRRWDTVPRDGAARPWLLGVARKVLSNQRRATSRRRRLTDRLGTLGAQPGDTPEVVTLRNAQDQEVIDALQDLDPVDQEVLMLIVWDELPRRDVAEILDTSIDAVHKRYQRAVRRLDRKLTLRSAEQTADGGRSR